MTQVALSLLHTVRGAGLCPSSMNMHFPVSSVFKTLLGLFLVIGLLYTFLVHRVFISSESFHRSQLVKQLQEEKQEINSISRYGAKAVDETTRQKEKPWMSLFLIVSFILQKKIHLIFILRTPEDTKNRIFS